MTDDYISPLLPHTLLIVTCEIDFLCVVVSQARHFVLPVCEGFPMTVAQGLIAYSFICNSVVPSDDWTSMGLSLHSLIILTGVVSIDPEQKRIIHLFVCSWLCVSSFPRDDTSYTYRTLSHPHPQQIPPFTSPYQIARPLLVTSRQASSWHDARRVIPQDLRPGSPRRGHVPPLGCESSTLECKGNTSAPSSSSVPFVLLHHLRTLNTARPLRSDRRNRPGPGRYKSTGTQQWSEEWV